MKTILESVTSVVKHWWWFVITGLIMLATGIIILLRPVEGYIGLSVLFTVVILSIGFSQIIFSLTNRKSMRGWGWILVAGILDVAIGVYLVMNPLITMATLPFVMGFWLIFRATFLIGSAFELKEEGIRQWWWLLLGGSAGVVFGFLVLIFPAAGVVGIIVYTSVAFLITGAFNVYFAVQLKKVKPIVKAVLV